MSMRNRKIIKCSDNHASRTGHGQHCHSRVFYFLSSCWLSFHCHLLDSHVQRRVHTAPNRLMFAVSLFRAFMHQLSFIECISHHSDAPFRNKCEKCKICSNGSKFCCFENICKYALTHKFGPELALDEPKKLSANRFGNKIYFPSAKEPELKLNDFR